MVSIPSPISSGQSWVWDTGVARYRPFEKGTLPGQTPNLSIALSIPAALITSHLDFCSNLRTDFTDLNQQLAQTRQLMPAKLLFLKTVFNM